MSIPKMDAVIFDGIPARKVGDPEMSELEQAMTARNTTPPMLNPVA
jgi:hypothetical protein